jgi:hypothetical protein
VQEAYETLARLSAAKSGGEDRFYKVSFNGAALWARAAAAGNGGHPATLYIRSE